MKDAAIIRGGAETIIHTVHSHDRQCDICGEDLSGYSLCITGNWMRMPGIVCGGDCLVEIRKLAQVCQGL